LAQRFSGVTLAQESQEQRGALTAQLEQVKQKSDQQLRRSADLEEIKDGRAFLAGERVPHCWEISMIFAVFFWDKWRVC